MGVAAACLGMVAVALLLLFAYAYNEKMEAVAAEDRAVQARDNAEKLVSFLLGERFLGEIRDSGRSRMLKSVQTQVGEGENQFAQLNSGLALRNAGDIERIAGHLDKATALFDLALKVMEDSPTMPIDDPKWLALRRELPKPWKRKARSRRRFVIMRRQWTSGVNWSVARPEQRNSMQPA